MHVFFPSQKLCRLRRINAMLPSLSLSLLSESSLVSLESSLGSLLSEVSRLISLLSILTMVSLSRILSSSHLCLKSLSSLTSPSSQKPLISHVLVLSMPSVISLKSRFCRNLCDQGMMSGLSTTFARPPGNFNTTTL